MIQAMTGVVVRVVAGIGLSRVGLTECADPQAVDACGSADRMLGQLFLS
jgi:hypothetical protein